MSVPKDLMEILACPKCKGDVRENSMFIVCSSCKLAYPVLDQDVPDMLIEDAWELEKAKKSRFKHNLKL
ncbi:MAG TPA: Trm112 family protein [archaeon]|nr:Trm112 family protein [archaeon]